MRIYLAGPITGLTYGEATDWRQYAVDFLASHGIEGVSPMRGKDYLLAKIGDKSVLWQTYEDVPLSSQRGITARDKWDVMSADAVLFNLLGAKTISMGSLVEYGWASAQDKLIVTVMEKTGNPMDHAFVRELSPFRLETLDQALEIIVAMGRGKHEGVR